ncbi:MAG: oxidoreductase [Rhizobiales bacterium]|nr:oxidoreductase [Hyphomicrobiales bacterium]MBA67405.1 oxidoreductase [Hyphomicrobiales bacterium]
MSARLVMKLRVAEVTKLTPEITGFRFVHPRRPRLPEWTAGAHVDVHLPDGAVRQYSLCGDPGDRSSYRIAVKREDGGRGGSAWLHAHAAADMEIPVSAPRNHFHIETREGRHVLIAGGIGVTPLLALARVFARENRDFAFHYCIRHPHKAAFVDELRELCGDRLTLWVSDEGAMLDPLALMDAERGAQLVVCGPAPLTDAIEAAADQVGWPLEAYHTERFTALSDAGFEPESFQAVIASTGTELDVPADRSLLSVLAENGIELDSSCEIGVCGSCECGYLKGDVIHRDVVLGPKAQRTRLMPCVSRAAGKVVLDL